MERHAVNILLGVSALLFVFGYFFASLGFFTIDEAIYVFAADTFLANRSLILENGWSLYPSGDLQWTELLTVGPNGLTSQYPPGTSFWALPMAVFGERGIILLNVLATAGSMFATRAVSLRLFGDARLALWSAILFLFGTFAVEYAFVFWPHMLTVLAVTLGFLLFLDALDRDTRAWAPAFASGLVIGAGLLFRIDTILVLPAIAVLTIVFGRAPFQISIGGAAGLVPALVILALANHVKFGTYNPISYGGKAGNTNLAAYGSFLVIMALMFVGLILLRLRGERGVPRWGLAVAAAAVAGAVVFVPALQSLAHGLVRGVVALIVDARTIESPYSDVRIEGGVTKMFWGLSKKSLGQSMPWIGVLALLVSGVLWREHRRSLIMLFVVFGIWSFPFLMRSWHGGMGSNMRYFLPLFPFLAALGVALIGELTRRLRDASRLLLYAVLAGFVIGVAWTTYMPESLASAHQVLSVYVFLAVVAVSLVAGFWRSVLAAQVAVLCVGIGVGVAGFNSFSDTVVSQLRRYSGRPLSDANAVIPGKVLVYTHMFRSAMLNPDQIVAVPQFNNNGPDPELVTRAMDEGYRVLMPERNAKEFITAQGADRFGYRMALDGTYSFYEIFRIDG